MQITLCGTGDAMGIPPAFCDLETCNADAKRRRSALLVEANETTILCDCGPDVKAQLRATDTKAIDGVFVTHFHHDHVGGIDELAAFAPVIGFDIHLTETAIGHFERERAHLTDEIEPRPIRAHQPVEIGAVTVTPLPVTHARPEFETVAFAIAADDRTVVYAPDVGRIDPDMSIPSEIALLVVGGNRLFRSDGGEDSIRKIVDPFAPERVVITHVNEWWLGQSTSELRRMTRDTGYELGDDYQMITV
ncbi:MBL fold metallo-hydrolase [Halocatena halophila]|uniref:MBL fold metallo-hydrolase n=1 Tax=Halocatena halophila TaxID=2814576 RepID=UPI002ED40095